MFLPRHRVHAKQTYTHDSAQQVPAPRPPPPLPHEETSMRRPHLPRAPFRALLSAACCAVLGAGLLAGAGTATASTSAPKAAAAASKVVGYFTEWGTYD